LLFSSFKNLEVNFQTKQLNQNVHIYFPQDLITCPRTKKTFTTAKKIESIILSLTAEPHDIDTGPSSQIHATVVAKKLAIQRIANLNLILATTFTWGKNLGGWVN
jgi:hypothetical protein